jgi:beta-lactamase regulating signal transducer with metallopeptidase domain
MEYLTPDSSFEFLSLLALAAAKATFLLAFVALINLAFRRISATTRHLLWTSALCAALLLPFLSFLTFWEIPVLPTELSEKASVSRALIESNQTLKMPETPMASESSVSDAASGGVREKYEAPEKTQFSEKFSPPWMTETSVRQTSPEKNAALSLMPQTVNCALAVWVAGVLLLLLRLFVGLAASGFLARRSREFKGAALNELFSALCIELNLKNKTRLQCGESTTMPIVCGVFRPVVLLPPVAEEWSKERQRIVLLHELAHVARHDCLTQMLAQIACAFYWFNPLVWIAARRLRVEREQACDNRVLSAGTKPSEYAHHLLEIARLMQEERSIFEWSQTSSVAMARQSQLEGRLLAILREENKFGAASRAATAGLVALMCFLLVSLAVIRPTVINATSKAALRGEKEVTATWTAETNGDKVTMQVVRQKDGFSNSTIHFTLAELQGLTMETLAAAKTDVSFKAAREAGTFLFEGYFKAGKGKGFWTLVPNQNFISAMKNRGFDNLSEKDLFFAALSDLNIKLIEDLKSAGYDRLSFDDVLEAAMFKIDSRLISEIQALGFGRQPFETLSEIRIFKITPEFVNEWRAAGFSNISLEELIELKIHKVTPEYLNEIKDEGFPKISPREAAELKIHRVDRDFIRRVKARGFNDVTLEQLVELRIHNVIK